MSTETPNNSVLNKLDFSFLSCKRSHENSRGPGTFCLVLLCTDSLPKGVSGSDVAAPVLALTSTLQQQETSRKRKLKGQTSAEAPKPPYMHLSTAGQNLVTLAEGEVGNVILVLNIRGPS